MSGASLISAGGLHSCANAGVLMCWGANVEGKLGSSTSQMCDQTACSTVPLTVAMDADLDGCLNSREQGVTAATGGLRSAKYVWDFFDTPTNAGARDAIIATGDIQRLVFRFGSVQVPPPSGSEALAQALGTPAPSGYAPAFDRSAPSPGGDPWDLNAPDGSIAVSDILFLVNQFGHSCV
jgi:hypothetical protein